MGRIGRRRGLVLLIAVLVVGLGSQPAIADPATAAPSALWRVRMYQASVGVPLGWFLIDVSSMPDAVPGSPALFQIASFDPEVRLTPTCVGGREGSVPPDGISIVVGTGHVPADPGAGCPSPTTTRWRVGERAYWSQTFAGDLADPTLAQEVLSGVKIPIGGTQSTAVSPQTTGPVVIIGAGRTPAGPWAELGEWRGKWLDFCDLGGSGGGGPTSGKDNGAPIQQWGWSGSGSDSFNYFGVHGISNLAVASVSFLRTSGPDKEFQGQLWPVPKSLFGGGQAFTEIVPAPRPIWMLHGTLVVRDVNGNVLDRLHV